MHKEFTGTLLKIFERDLRKLEHEISQYTNEQQLWLLESDIKNPAGNLALHLCGNLQHYIGKVLGKTDYVRNRDLEFAARNVSQKDLLLEIEKTRAIVLHVLSQMDVELLEKPYPEKVFDYQMTTAYFLVHLSGHLNYHLGQINYHRRLTGRRVALAGG
jgi:hypothetical protein